MSPDELIEIIAAWPQTDLAEQRARGQQAYAWASAADENDWRRLVELLRQVDPTSRAAADSLLSVMFSAAPPQRWGHTLVSTLYRDSDPQSSLRRTLLFQWAEQGDVDSLKAFVELIVEAPPASSDDGAAVFAPFLQRGVEHPEVLFPALFAGLAHVSIAAPILDLANFLHREQTVPKHPGEGRAEEFGQLLAGIATRLSRLEERPEEVDRSLGAIVRDSSALAVAFCHTLALLNARDQLGCLYQAMELSHRRIRVEAAAALAKLGESAGEEVLVQMAAEPVVRLYAIAFADELGLLERIPEEQRDEGARAEAELSLWLAQPAQFGFPPTRIEQLDHRTLYWPGYDDEMDCRLLRFVYQFDQDEFSGIGLAGPTTYAFAADLSHLPHDDLYAAFAGRDAEHEEIYHRPFAALDAAQKTEAERWAQRLQSQGYEDVEPEIWGHFFGDRTLVARATKDGHPAVAVVDGQEVFSRPAGDLKRPLGAEEAYCIYKGRKLLRSFNEPQ